MQQKYIHKPIFFIFLFVFSFFTASAQKGFALKTILEPADSFDKKRVWGMTSLCGGLYSGVTVGLNQLWYAQYPQSRFHTFNDNGEWMQMDKAGHVFTAYIYSHWAHKAYRWAGVSQRKSIWVGVAAGTVLQATLEVMDGFSTQWGFSPGDITANTLGTLAFAGQEWAWNEQRITMKVSSQQLTYPNDIVFSKDGKFPTTTGSRLQDLGGTNIFERLIKDYDAQTLWASVNVASFLPPETQFPKWLNVAVGYGVKNVYGGYVNSWQGEKGVFYDLDPNKYPRTRQFYFSLDVDVNRLNIKNKYLKTVAFLLCHAKIASPTLEITSKGQVRGHLLYW